MELQILQTLSWKINFIVPGEITRFILNLYFEGSDDNIFEKIDNFIDLSVSCI